MPRLSRYSALHLDVDVRLNSSADRVDLSAGEADFAIRYGTVFPESGVEVIPSPEEAIVVLCSPELADRERPIRAPEDLRDRTLIFSKVNLVSWRDWLDQMSVGGVAADPAPVSTAPSWRSVPPSTASVWGSRAASHPAGTGDEAARPALRHDGAASRLPSPSLPQVEAAYPQDQGFPRMAGYRARAVM